MFYKPNRLQQQREPLNIHLKNLQRDQKESSYNRYNNNYDDQDSDSEPARPVTRGLINFSGARQRAMSRKAHSKTTKRAHDLLQMIELDVSSYDLFDLPPVKEYDLYIRSFGRTDTKQVTQNSCVLHNFCCWYWRHALKKWARINL